MRSLLLIFLFFVGINARAQTQFLFMPSYEDLNELSRLFEKTNKPVPVHIAYNSDQKGSLVLAIAISQRARNGVHARMLVSAGIVNDLYEAKKSDHGYKAGTLFLERQGDRPVLSVHSRNSYRSTVNMKRSGGTHQIYFTKDLLLELVQSTNIMVVKASENLHQVIREENERRYLGHLTDSNERIRAMGLNSLNERIYFSPPDYEAESNFLASLKANSERASQPELVKKLLEQHSLTRACRQTVLP